MEKLKNGYTINVDDELKNMIEALAQYYQRRPRELLRLFLRKIIIDGYAKMQLSLNKNNDNDLQAAIFKQ